MNSTDIIFYTNKIIKKYGLPDNETIRDALYHAIIKSYEHGQQDVNEQLKAINAKLEETLDTEQDLNRDAEGERELLLQDIAELKKQIEAQKAINLELVDDNAQIISYNKKMRNCANCTRKNCKGLDGTSIILIKNCIDNDRQLWEMRT